MAMACSSSMALTSSKSAVMAGTQVRAFTASTAQPGSRRARLEVCAKGKQRMRTGGNSRMTQQMQQNMTPPTPPVDPDNEEFVIFVRSKKLPQWVPLSVVKGGTAANMLVKGLETDLMRDVTLKTLVENIGKAVYKDKDEIISAVRSAYPPFKAATEFVFGFKIRDKSDPKSWYVPKDLMEIPPEEELGGGGAGGSTNPLDSVKDFFSKSLGI